MAASLNVSGSVGAKSKGWMIQRFNAQRLSFEGGAGEQAVHYAKVKSDM